MHHKQRHSVCLVSVLFSLFFLSVSYSSAQDNNTNIHKNDIEIFFDISSYDIDKDFADNRANLDKLSALLDKLSRDPNTTITRINVSSYTSPDGGVSLNRKLAQLRKESLYDYLIVYESVFSSIIDTVNYSNTWDVLREKISMSQIPHKDEVLEIIQNVPIETWSEDNKLTDSRLQHIKNLHNGESYRFMRDYIFPELRSGSVLVIHYRVEEPEQVLAPLVEVVQDVEEDDTAQVVEEPQPISEVETLVEKTKRAIALKTNLALYVGGVLNLGVEFQVCDNFSVDIPIAYSPYTVSETWKFRTLAIQPELRYWFSETFKGHFVGVHAHVGYFNIAYDDQNRYQNSDETPLWGFGVSYGYLLNLPKGWNLEFTLGAGYTNLEYDTYYNIENGALYDHSVKDYWGITRLGISLTYIF